MSHCFHVRTLLRLLKGIDSLPQGATGALVFTSRDTPQGTVLIEDNRVCWAAASNMERRLTDILRRQTDPPLRVDDFEAIYEECHQNKIPLGETLLKRQIVTSDGLWRAIRQHTAEAIAMLSTTEKKLTPVWASNRARRYDAQFIFSTAEILSSIGAFGNEGEAAEATRILNQITPGNTVGVAYLMEGPGLPIAQVSADSWKCQALVDLGEWARVAADRKDGEAETLIRSGAGTAIKRAFHGAEIIYVRWSARAGEQEPSEIAISMSVS